MSVIQVKPFHWEREEKILENNNHLIRVWALDNCNKPYLLRIEDFPASCTIFLPKVVNHRHVMWNEFKARAVYNAIKTSLGNTDTILPFHRGNFEYLKPLYEFQLPAPDETMNIVEAIKSGKSGTLPAITLYFRNASIMYSVNKKLEEALYVEGVGRTKLDSMRD